MTAPPPTPRRLLVDAVALAVVVFGLSVLAVTMRPAGSDTAVWWPAAGLAVAWVARRGRRGLLLTVPVGLAAGAANLAAGRPLELCLVFALANGAEALVAGWVLTVRGRFVLDDVGDLGRFVVATLLGGLAAGTIAAAGVVTVLDGSGPATLQSVVVTHAAATLLVGPVVLVDRRPFRRRSRRAVAELALQWVAVVGVTVAVFLPGQHLPLTFVTVPALAWTAVRSGVRATTGQLLVVGILSTAATVQGLGPFVGASSDPRVVVGMVQLFVLVTSSTLLVLALDVQQRSRLTRTITEREALYRGGFEDAMLGMLLSRFDGEVLRVLQVNAVGARLLGSPGDALVGTAWCRSILAEDLPSFEAGVLEVVGGTAAGWHGEVRVAPNGRTRWLEVAIAPAGVRGSDPVVLVQLVDVTERRADHAHLQQLALHDSLTTLPNRVLLLDRLEHALVAAPRSGASVGVVYVDLDRFKQVNDTGGHAVGDEVLIATARRLTSLVRPGDTVARLGGDEFAVVCPVVADAAEIREVAERIVGSLSRPLEVGGTTYHVGASAGVALGDATATAGALLHAADVDMYVAKSRRRPAAGSSRLAAALR